jgi:hypothetical protein
MGEPFQRSAKRGRWISEPRIYTEITRSRVGGPVYVIGGPREARLTIYSQQCRAINLVCALRERESDLTRKRIAIVGAGAAGLTAATALSALGVPDDNLTVFEKTASPIHAQRWSYGRFLHPRLFHWPEAGWRDSQSELPVADWRAEYAADVREQILAGCAPFPIEFCTLVSKIRSQGSVARVDLRHLHSPWSEHREFDLVLVATGFPLETKIEGTLGGTYWHALEGLDELQGDIHVVGDGDGALTEILMMLIDRFGHAAIEELCEWLPLKDVDRLHARDLEAQGNPSECATPSEEEVRSPLIGTLFDLLGRRQRRIVTVHSPRPLSGASFLLNRALVTHLTWGREPVVSLQSGRRIEPSQVGSLGGKVIWRAGVTTSPGPEFAQARVTTKDLLKSLDPSGKVGSLEAGLLVGLLDGLRRPMWSPEADAELRAGLARGGQGWAAPPVRGLTPVVAQPSETAEELLAVMAATAADLAAIGIEGLDALEVDDGRWVSIDLLARTGECPHEQLLQWPRLALEKEPGEPRDESPTVKSQVRRDEWNRIWFRLPSGPSQAPPSRGAVRALLPRDVLLRWAEREPGSDEAVSRERVDRLGAGAEVLKGLGDIAVGDRRANLLLAALHEARQEWEATKRAYLRAGRQPGGKRLGTAGSRDLNGAFREVLLRLAGAILRVGKGEGAAVNHAIWLLHSAAAANLVTLFGNQALLLELNTTPAFLRRTWAPRVRSTLRRSGWTDSEYARGEPPGWARELADAALDLSPPEADTANTDQLDRLPSLATEVAKYAEQEIPPDPLVSLSEMGVWLAGSETDRELRRSFSEAR